MILPDDMGDVRKSKSIGISGNYFNLKMISKLASHSKFQKMAEDMFKEKIPFWQKRGIGLFTYIWNRQSLT